MFVFLKDRIIFEEGKDAFVPSNLNAATQDGKSVLQQSFVADTALEGPVLFSLINVLNEKDIKHFETAFIGDAMKGLDEVRAKKSNLEERYKDNLKYLAFYYFMSCARYAMAKNAHVIVYAPFTNEQLSHVIEEGLKTKEEIAKVRGFGEQFKKNYLDTFVENVNFFHDNIDKHEDLNEYITQLKAKRAQIKKEYEEEMVIWSKTRPTIETK